MRDIVHVDCMFLVARAFALLRGDRSYGVYEAYSAHNMRRMPLRPARILRPAAHNNAVRVNIQLPWCREDTDHYTNRYLDTREVTWDIRDWTQRGVACLE